MCYCGGCTNCLMAQGWTAEDFGEHLHADREDADLDFASLSQALCTHPPTDGSEPWFPYGSTEYRVWVELREALYADVDRLAEVA